MYDDEQFVARALGLAESSVKRMLSVGDMPLSRVDTICRILKLDFAELARRVADGQQLLAEMTQEQERAVVGDKKLLLVAICIAPISPVLSVVLWLAVVNWKMLQDL